MNLQNTGEVCRENAEVCLAIVARMSGAICGSAAVPHIAPLMRATSYQRHCRGAVRKPGQRLFSLRLLLQIRMRAAEVGGGGILADLDDAAADGAGPGEMLEQRLAAAPAARR